MTEQKIQAKVIKEMEAKGYYVIKLKMTNKNGIPDLIAIPPNSDVEFIEVKKTNGKVSKLQEYRIEELQEHGCKVIVRKGL
jgi:Holliday junction resolvase|tara:strand:- start:5226 stop:5468 length:243 start_codon:yes stop_codon:yes gene_type:complete